ERLDALLGLRGDSVDGGVLVGRSARVRCDPWPKFRESVEEIPQLGSVELGLAQPAELLQEVVHLSGDTDLSTDSAEDHLDKNSKLGGAACRADRRKQGVLDGRDTAMHPVHQLERLREDEAAPLLEQEDD